MDVADECCTGWSCRRRACAYWRIGGRGHVGGAYSTAYGLHIRDSFCASLIARRTGSDCVLSSYPCSNAHMDTALELTRNGASTGSA
eukprot:17819-Eustigmatos_ZCMA.PRE.1